jgi:hypothetical protein
MTELPDWLSCHFVYSIIWFIAIKILINLPGFCQRKPSKKGKL